MTDPADRSLAIIGIGCRFPGGADTPARFWELLRAGTDAVAEVPPDRWHMNSVYDPDYRARGRIHQRHGGFIDRIREFDAAFFGISPKEASRIDPQQRILLESAHQGLEDAGIPPFGLARSSTGVFVGISTHDYSDLQSRSSEHRLASPYTNSGGALSIAANRISYAFDLRGPSLAIETACSSTLTALHVARMSLQNGDCDLALVGGVNALLMPGITMGFSRGMFLSGRGRCQAFSAHADGYVRAEGAGVVVLKPLSRAIADGDRIYAVVRHTAVNEDGRTEGMALPSLDAQARLLEHVYRSAQIDTREVGYVEAHGTGTVAGDAIEASALGGVLGRGRAADRPCLVGTVKTNIGHLEAASAAAGIIKLALCLHRREIPRSLHSEELNPRIPFAELGLEVVREHRRWPAWNDPPRGGVSAFGFGGANAHAVLEAAEQVPPARTRAEGTVVVPLSARSDKSLRELALRHLQSAREADGPSLADIAHSVSRHRDHHPVRAAILACDRSEWEERLEAVAAGRPAPGVVTGHAPATPGGVAFVCSGQGPQWWGMGRDLYRADRLFREAIDEVDRLLRGTASWRLVEELFERDETSSRIDETWLTQPALFAFQVALARRCQSLGIEPAAVVGHSVGEVAAAVIAGTLSLERGAFLIYHRGRIQDAARGAGRMLAVGLSESAARKRIGRFDGRVSIAAINRPELVAIAGDADAIAEIAGELAAQDVFHRIVNVTVPFHSRHMDTLKGELLTALAAVPAGEARLALYSTVTGRRVRGPELAGEYWFRGIRDTVRFVPAIRTMIRDGYRTFVELSPHPILSPGIEDLLREANVEGAVLPSMRRGASDAETLHGSVATLYSRGHTIAPALPGRFVDLPLYPWDREVFWSETEEGRLDRLSVRPHPLVRRRNSSLADASRHTFELEFDPRVDRWLRDHKLQGQVVVPAAALLEAALGCGRDVFGEEVVLHDVSFDRALFLPDGPEELPSPVALEIDGDDGQFVIASRAGAGEPTRHVRGFLRPQGLASFQPSSTEELLGRCTPVPQPERLYARLSERGLQFGRSFRVLREVKARGEGPGRAEAVARVTLGDGIRTDGYTVHPLLLDGCFQSLIAMPFVVPGLGTRVYLPVGARRVSLREAHGREFLACARVTEASARRVLADLWLVDDEGTVVAAVEGFEGRLLDGSDTGLDPDDHCYALRWVPADRADQKRHRESATVLAPPDSVETTVRARAAAAVADLPNAAHAALDEQIDRLAFAHIVKALAGLGVVWQPGFVVPSTLSGVAPRRHLQRLSGHLLRAARQRGLLAAEPCGSAFRVVGAPDAFPEDLEAALARDERTAHDAALVGHAGRNLEAVLRGERDGVEVLFAPEVAGSLALFYRQNYHKRQSARLLADAMAALVRHVPTDRTLRVLEVGAGTGAGTEALLPQLPADRTEYVFTDVSPAFFAAAKARFGRAGMRFAVLDLEHDVEEQGFEPGGFDIVVASDVLHATANLRATLARVRQLLGGGGALLAVEVTRAPLSLDLIFGLTDGWWSFDDEDLRPSHPMLAASTWRSVLESAGFEGVVAATYQDESAAVTGQHVLVARNPSGALAAPSAGRTDGSVLLTGDATPLSAALERRLRGEGLWTEHVDMSRLGNAVRAAPKPVRAIVDVHAAAAAGRDRAAADLVELHRCTTKPQMALATEVAHSSLNPAPRLVLVTSGAVALPADRSIDPMQAPVWGVGRTMAAEYQHLSFRLVDVSADGGAAEVEALARECLAESDDIDVALRGERRLVLRIDRVPPDRSETRPAAPAEAFRLDIARRGVLDSMAFRRCERASLEPDAVEIEVRAAGLNFRDLMNAMGLLPAGVEQPGLGLECSGIVSRVGSGVADLQPGDEVMGLSARTMARYAIASRRAVILKPGNLTHEEAATIPVAVGTAWYCLEEVARLRSRERVLIHSATGGVGHAAIQIATRCGAEILATAGTEARRAYLRELGIRHVFDSRSTRWADDVRAATDGQGVDVVLNSLAGGAIFQGLEVLAPLGRFVEIGIADVFENRRLGLRAFRSGASYFTVRLDLLLRQQPDTIQCRILQPLAALLETGSLTPLPMTLVPAAHVMEAFALMAQSQHRGKLVVSFEPGAAVPVACDPEPLMLDGTRAYLVTGGTRGVGFRLAEWLVSRGARHLVLVSRSGRLEDEASRRVERWRAEGVTVRVSAVDVGDQAALASELAAVRRERALGGIVHGAMVLADAPVETLDDEKFIAALGPKAGGALNLDQLTREDNLAFFILLSSVASVVGNPGQANYSAANAMLEALAHRRRLEGRPATVVNLGAIEDTGFVARSEAIGRHVDRLGVVPMPSDLLLPAIERALRHQAVQWGIGMLHPGRILAAIPSSAARLGWLGQSDGDAPGSGTGVLAEIQQLTGSHRTARVTGLLREAVARITGADPASVPTDRRLTDLGLDSLMATQLSSWIRATLGLDPPTMRLLKGPTIAELAAELASAIAQPDGAGPVAHAEACDPPGAAIPTRRPVSRTGPEAEARLAELRTDAVLDPSLQVSGRMATPDWHRGRAFVTGATGFIGAHVFEMLLRRSSAAFTCLVRASDPEDGRSRIQEAMQRYGLWHDAFAGRFDVVAGNLGSRRFGLAPDAYDRLMTSCDFVLHVAAQMNFVSPYGALKAVNVDGVHEVLRFCCAGRLKPLHHVSTAAIWPMGATRRFREDDDLDHGTRLDLGYYESKWVAEQLLREARGRGLPITIYRPGEVSGDSETGRGAVDHFMLAIIKASLQMQLAPDVKCLIDMAPIDYVAAAIAALVMDPSAAGGTYHLNNPSPCEPAVLHGVAREYGYPFTLVPPADWIATVLAHEDLDENALDSYRAVLEDFEEESLELPIYDTTHARAALEGTGVRCPPVSAELLRRYFDWFIDVGFFPPAESLQPTLLPHRRQ